MPSRFQPSHRLGVLRARVAEQRAILQHLQRTFTDASMKGCAERGLVELDVVEAVIVARLHPSMTPDEEEALHRDTSPTLRSAIRTRSALQAALHNCGADATLPANSHAAWQPRTRIRRLREVSRARPEN